MVLKRKKENLPAMTITIVANQKHQQQQKVNQQNNSNDKSYSSLEISSVLSIVVFLHLEFISSCLNMR